MWKYSVIELVNGEEMDEICVLTDPIEALDFCVRYRNGIYLDLFLEDLVVRPVWFIDSD